MPRSGLSALLTLCTAAALSGQEWRAIEPPGRTGHGFSSHLASGRTIVFGGTLTLYGVLRTADTWQFDGVRWTQVDTANQPTARVYHAMSDDIQRGRVVLFGGSADGGLVNDTWEFDGVNWSRVATPTGPSARRLHAMGYDLVRNRTVLFGGEDSGGVLADTWEFDGLTWRSVATVAAPPARRQHGLAFDLNLGRMVLFGGRTAATGGLLLGDTWEFDGVNWRQIATPVSPAPRTAEALATDFARSRLLLLGGQRASASENTWEFDGITWAPVPTPAEPTGGMGHGLAWHPGRGRVLSFGGWDGDLARHGDTSLAETWEFDGASWSRLGGPPSFRVHPAMAVDTARDRVVLFGGIGPTGAHGDTWELEGERWYRIATAGAPPARGLHAMAYDTRRGRTVMFGAPGTDTWEYDGGAWLSVTTAAAPSARAGHAMVYDSARERMVLYGGQAGSGFLGDTWEYDGRTWTRIATAATPGARSGHGFAYDSGRGRTVLFGGAAQADTWEYDGSRWTSIATPVAPAPRSGHAMVYDSIRGRTVLYGSEPNLAPVVWEYDGRTWASSQPGNAPRANIWHAMAFDSARGRAVLFGGVDVHHRLADTWALLPPRAPTWARHGIGCAGSGGIPALDAPGLPALGTTLPLQCTGLPVQPGAMFLVFGTGIARWGGRALPLDLDALGLAGCRLWIEPGTGTLVPHAGGTATVRLTLPASQALAGQRIALQALVLDGAAANGVGAVTNAGIMRLH